MHPGERGRRVAEEELRPLQEAGPLRPRRVPASTILHHVVINFFMLLIILPLAWVLLLSIKSIPDAYTGELWPRSFDFSHYGYVLSKIQTLPRNMLNSVVVTLATVVITTVCAILAGYALVHVRLPGRAAMILLLTASLFFPTRIVSLPRRTVTRAM